MSFRQSLYQQLVPEARASGISLLNLFIVSVVLASFLFLALETEPVLNTDPRWMTAFNVFNIAVLAIFTVEYVARLWVAGVDPQYKGFRGRIKYATRFYSVADFLAFAPELIVMLAGGVVAKSLHRDSPRPLRSVPSGFGIWLRRAGRAR